MTERIINHPTTRPAAARPSAQASLFLQIALARSQRAPRIALPTPPVRRFCVARRGVLAALRAAELAHWQATGGDSLRDLPRD